jgi:hypothetical protein
MTNFFNNAFNGLSLTMHVLLNNNKGINLPRPVEKVLNNNIALGS